VQGYPPVAQILGLLMNSIFIDALDQDAFTLGRINELVDDLPPGRRHQMRPVRLLQMRPSVDLGRLAGERTPDLPAPLSIIARSLGTEETQSPDWLSVLLFEEKYIARLLEAGYEDAREYQDQLELFFSDEPMVE
jgi:NTE family protein